MSLLGACIGCDVAGEVVEMCLGAQEKNRVAPTRVMGFVETRARHERQRPLGVRRLVSFVSVFTGSQNSKNFSLVSVDLS